MKAGTTCAGRRHSCGLILAQPKGNLRWQKLLSLEPDSWEWFTFPSMTAILSSRWMQLQLALLALAIGGRICCATLLRTNRPNCVGFVMRTSHVWRRWAADIRPHKQRLTIKGS